MMCVANYMSLYNMAYNTIAFNLSISALVCFSLYRYLSINSIHLQSLDCVILTGERLASHTQHILAFETQQQLRDGKVIE